MSDRLAAALHLSGITRTFRQADAALEVLRGVDLDVRPGEMVALVGPSGAGKSTLLQIAGLLERPTAGEVEIAGRGIHEPAPHRVGDIARHRRGGAVAEADHPVHEVVLHRDVRGRAPADLDRVRVGVRRGEVDGVVVDLGVVAAIDGDRHVVLAAPGVRAEDGVVAHHRPVDLGGQPDADAARAVDDAVALDDVAAARRAVPHVDRVLGEAARVGHPAALARGLPVRGPRRAAGVAVDPLEPRVVDGPVARVVGVDAARVAGGPSIGRAVAPDVVAAGLVIGNLGPGKALSERTQAHLFPFWQLMDEILNLLLFGLIGLELLALQFQTRHLVIGVVMVPMVLFARWISVGVPMRAMQRLLPERDQAHTVSVMTWGGLRGGISIALALSLPNGAEKEPIVWATYIVVLFSILVQATTLGPLMKKLGMGGATTATDAGH